MNTALIMLAAVLLDRLLGEVRSFHPLVGFGRYANFLECRLNTRNSRTLGALAWTLAIVPFLALVIFLSQQPALQFVAGVLALYFALGLQSLHEHASRIQTALQDHNLNAAQRAVAQIVSRDTQAMQAEDVARAGVESVLENGNDAVFGALFWFALLGAPGALLYRLANTLDAMWGYRTARFLHFGWAAARLDDALNFIPARLTALSYALLGNASCAWRCWRQQAPQWDSPNAGPVMAAGAGSLQLRLGGAASYHGQLEPRPDLGVGEAPQAADLARAVQLVQRGVWLWLLIFLAIGAWRA